MKTTLTSLILFSIFWLDTIAEDSSRWGLPEGAKARLGKGIIYDLKYSPDGTRLAAASSSGVWLYDSATGEPVSLLRHGNLFSAARVAFSPDSRMIVSYGDVLRMWDAVTGELRHTVRAEFGSAWYVAFSADGRTFAAQDDKVVRLWDAETGVLKHTIRTTRGEGFSDAWSFAVSPDGSTLASGHRSLQVGHSERDGVVRLWDTATGELQTTFSAGVRRPTSLAFSPDGRTLAVGHLDWAFGFGSWGWATLRDAATGEFKHLLEAHRGGVHRLAFSADGRTLASGSRISKEYGSNAVTVRIWDAATGANLRSLEAFVWEVGSLALSPDGSALAVASWDAIHIWDAETGAKRRSLNVHGGEDTFVTYSPDGSTLASGSTDNTVRLWDALTGENTRTLEGHTGDITSVAYSPDGRTLASASNDGTVLLWELFPHVEEPMQTTPDVNEDGVVNVQDLVLVAGRLGESGEKREDVNGDGAVNILDLVLVAGMADDSTDALPMVSNGAMMIRTSQVKEWLEGARQLTLAHPAIPRGIENLENLLEALTPERTLLLPNFPNPFNPETWIPYQLARDSIVRISINNVKGVLVRQLDLGLQPEGYYTDKHYAAYWDGRNEAGELLASGLYVYVFQAGSYRASRRMAIVR